MEADLDKDTRKKMAIGLPSNVLYSSDYHTSIKQLAVWMDKIRPVPSRVKFSVKPANLSQCLMSVDYVAYRI